jgi:TRAP-type uncharacterized transport system fused permease subunit
MGLEGYLSGKINTPLRMLAAAAGLLLIYPGTVSDIIGIIGVGLVVVLNILSARRTKNAEPAV